MSPAISKSLAATLFITAFLFSGLCPAADPKPGDTPQSDSKTEKQFLLRVYRVPPSFLECDKPGHQTIKAFLEEAGVPFPPGSEAIFQSNGPTENFVVVRQTQENIDFIDQVFPNNDLDRSCVQLETEISTYQYTTEAVLNTGKGGNLTLDFLKSASKSLILLDRIVCLSISGQKAEVTHSTDNLKSSAGVESVLGPDGETVDIILNYHLTIPASASLKTKPLEITAPNKVYAKDGIPIVVKSFVFPDVSKPASRAANKGIAIVIRVDVVDATGMRVREIEDKLSAPPK